MKLLSPRQDNAVLNAIHKSQAVIEFTPDGVIENANNLFLNTMGYNKDEIIGQHHSLFVDNEYKYSPDYKRFWQELKNGTFSTGVYKRFAKGGREIWLSASYNPVTDKNGNITKVVKLASDITADRLTSAYNSGQLSAIHRSLAVIEFDPQGNILNANDNFLNTMGYELEDIMGQHHQMFVDKQYAQSHEYVEFWNGLRAGNYTSDVFKRYGREGKEVWIQACYNPIYDMNGKLYRVVKYATDVTKDKLRSAYFKGQIEAIGRSQAVIEFNLDGTVVNANENFLDALGHDLNDIVGQHHGIFVEKEHTSTPEYKAFWEDLRAGKYSVGEYKRIAKCGKEIYIQASYNPIFDMNGKPYKVVKYASDITQQVQLRKEAADRSNETSANIQTVAGAAEEMLASVKEIAMNMQRSQTAIGDIVQQNDEANHYVGELQNNTKSMEDIVALIRDISEQVNLLALNATIEAARAGEAGKGFAVVAGEVKSLANQTAAATDRITTEITNIQNIVGKVVQSSQAISAGTAAVGESVETIAAAIEEQEAVTGEISQKMQVIAQGVQSLDEIIQMVGSSK